MEMLVIELQIVTRRGVAPSSRVTELGGAAIVSNVCRDTVALAGRAHRGSRARNLSRGALWHGEVGSKD